MLHNLQIILQHFVQPISDYALKIKIANWKNLKLKFDQLERKTKIKIKDWSL